LRRPNKFYFSRKYLCSLHRGGRTWAFEHSFIDAPVPDNARSFFAVSPSARILTPWIQPALSMVTNVGDPLYPSAIRFWAVRIAITTVIDPVRQRVEGEVR
jgi:hypothetical protein